MRGPAVMGVVWEAVDVSFAVLSLQVEQFHLRVKAPLCFFEILVLDSFSLKDLELMVRRCCKLGRLSRLSTLLADGGQWCAEGWDVVGGEAAMQGRAAIGVVSGAIQGKEGGFIARRTEAAGATHAVVGHGERGGERGKLEIQG